MNITGGFLNSRRIKVSELENIKPTLSKIRQGIFNSLATLTQFQDKKFLDMFSGSGIMAFEAYSRGFQVYSFEKDKMTFNEIKRNAQILDVEGKFMLGNALKLISKLDERYDVIYLDPPYQSDLYEKALEIIKNERFLNPGGFVILERKTEKITDTEGFNIIKSKIYADKQIDFLTLI